MADKVESPVMTKIPRSKLDAAVTAMNQVLKDEGTFQKVRNVQIVAGKTIRLEAPGSRLGVVVELGQGPGGNEVTCVVDAAILSKFVKGLPTPAGREVPVEISAEGLKFDGNVSVVAAPADVALMLCTPAPAGERWVTVPGPEILRALGPVLFAVSTEKVRQALTKVYLETEKKKPGVLNIVASDGTCLSWARVPARTAGTGSCFLSPSILRSAERFADAPDAELSISLEREGGKKRTISTAHLSVGPARFWEGGQDDLRFPDYKAVIPKHDSAWAVPLGDLREAVKRAHEVVKKDQVKRHPIRLEFGPSSIAVRAKSELGKIDVSVLAAGPGRKIEVQMNSLRLLEFLDRAMERAAAVAIKVGNDGQGLVFEIPDGVVHVLMPLKD